MNIERFNALPVIVAICLGLVSACTMPALEPIRTSGEQPYRFGAGDRVRVSTYGEQPLTNEYAVDGTGKIQFPLIGDVVVAGKTAAELRDDISESLSSEFLRNPRVAVEVAAYRPVYVLGEVAKPGEVAFSERMTVFAVIAKAGGFTYRANRKYIYIRHENDPDEKAYPFAPSLSVSPGDQVRISELIF